MHPFLAEFPRMAHYSNHPFLPLWVSKLQHYRADFTGFFVLGGDNW